MTLQIEEGKFYIRRDGEMVGPAEKRPPHESGPTRVYPWRVGDDTYTHDGRLFIGGHSYADLVSVSDPTATDSTVDHPAHYTSGAIECFDAMAAMLTREELVGYLRGNSFKYRWRFRHKNGVEDLRKAEWYEKRLLEILAHD